MDGAPDPQGPPLPVEPEKLREILVRVVGRVCPSWMASQREDLVQEACLRILKVRRSAEEDQGLQTSYLWKVAHSAVMDEIRRRRRRPEAEMENPGLAEDHAPGRSPEAARGASEVREAVDEGLGRLAEPRRRAVQLWLYGFSLQESARILGWSAKRVDNQRYQGLAALRAWLEEKGLKP